MEKYYVRDGGNTYCEGPESEMERFPDAMEVPKRPSIYYKWQDDGWVYNTELYTEINSPIAIEAISDAAEQKVIVTNLTDLEIAEIDEYVASIKAAMAVGEGEFPSQPDCLNPERVWQ